MSGRPRCRPRRRLAFRVEHPAFARQRVAQVHDAAAAALDLLTGATLPVAAQARELAAHDAIAVGERLHGLQLRIGAIRRVLDDALAAQLARSEGEVVVLAEQDAHAGIARLGGSRDRPVVGVGRGQRSCQGERRDAKQGVYHGSSV